MITRPRTHLLVPLLALGMALAMTATAQARDRYTTQSSGTSARLEINFGSSPRWTSVPGTSVRRLRDRDRSRHDMFRYGRDYYVYNNANNRWYRSRNWRGQFMLISDRSVPSQFRRVPRSNWRHYPMAWEDRDGRGSYATIQVNFGGRPRWSGIRGTRVEAVYGAGRPGYDVFRYGGSYYAYSNDRWYTSSRESGEFILIDDRSVPSEFTRVPRDRWRNYPSAWEDRDYSSGWEDRDYSSRWEDRNDRGRSSATLQVTFGSRPRWTGISGTRVEAIYGSLRPSYDLFRLDGRYYAYSNDQWYSSTHETGRFTMIDDRSVPNEFTKLSRTHWRNYPSNWDENADGRYDDNDGRYYGNDRRGSREGRDQGWDGAGR